MSSLEAVVAALRRSDARSSVPRFFVHAAVGAGIWVGAVLLITRLVPFERRLQLALLGVPVMLAVAATAWLASRPGPGVLMSVADQSLGLKERLSTAWERRASSGLMDDLQRLDALQHAERARLARAFPMRVNRREVGVLAIVAVAALLLAILPNPMDRLLAQQRADAASQAAAANAVHAVEAKIAANATTVPPDPKVQKILAPPKSRSGRPLTLARRCKRYRPLSSSCCSSPTRRRRHVPARRRTSPIRSARRKPARRRGKP